ncbi:unnamed protein product [Miscanthus lutarioriparius]|uniref:Uncharacterized protein n=1 Tax=Miscanthus lutarioriparius TaxID=422564 RepID=A0A811QJU7_9POAL|nr:unnamed protein product [Miscanthus lutarioriparius]
MPRWDLLLAHAPSGVLDTAPIHCAGARSGGRKVCHRPVSSIAAQVATIVRESTRPASSRTAATAAPRHRLSWGLVPRSRPPTWALTAAAEGGERVAAPASEQAVRGSESEHERRGSDPRLLSRLLSPGTHKMLHPSWVSVSACVSEYWSVIIATVVFAFVGVVTIYYTVLNKNISLSLIKAIKARAKRCWDFEFYLSLTNGANESASTVRETIIQIHSKSSGAIELPYDVEGDSQEVNNAAKRRDDQANGELNEVHQSSESEKDKPHVPDNAATTSRSNVQCENSHVQNDQKYEIISVTFEMLLSYKIV